MKKNNSLPIFGVGPIYVLSCLSLTILGLILNHLGYLEIGKVDKAKTLFVIIGFILIILGLYLWVKAVLIQKINARVKDEILITNGVYGIVRNPVYTAFIYIFTGILLFAKKLSLVSLANYFLDIFDNFDEKKRRKMAKGQVRQGIWLVLQESKSNNTMVSKKISN